MAWKYDEATRQWYTDESLYHETLYARAPAPPDAALPEEQLGLFDYPMAVPPEMDGELQSRVFRESGPDDWTSDEEIVMLAGASREQAQQWQDYRREQGVSPPEVTVRGDLDEGPDDA